MLNNLLQMYLKLLQKEQFKKLQKQLVIESKIKMLKELQVSKTSPQKNSETNEEILSERYTSPEDRKLLMI